MKFIVEKFSFTTLKFMQYNFFLGYHLDFERLKPSSSKVEAIIAAPRHKNVTRLIANFFQCLLTSSIPCIILLRLDLNGVVQNNVKNRSQKVKSFLLRVSSYLFLMQNYHPYMRQQHMWRRSRYNSYCYWAREIHLLCAVQFKSRTGKLQSVGA